MVSRRAIFILLCLLLSLLGDKPSLFAMARKGGKGGDDDDDDDDGDSGKGGKGDRDGDSGGSSSSYVYLRTESTPKPTRSPIVPFMDRSAIRINSGGSALSVGDGMPFGGDNFFKGGREATDLTAATVRNANGNEDLYRTERVDDDLRQGFSYELPIPMQGRYILNLYFAEQKFLQFNERLFNVTVNGDRKLENYDIFLEASGKDSAVIEKIIVDVEEGDGYVDIDFSSVRDLAKVNAIELVRSQLQPPTFNAPLRINSGGSNLTVDGVQYIDDSYFDGGRIVIHSAANVNNADGKEVLYSTERVDDEARSGFSYSFPAAHAGRYMLALFFSETEFMQMNQRLFDVTVNGNPWLENYDIFRAARGKDIAVIERIFVDVEDEEEGGEGVIDVVFSSVKETAKVNAIELFRAG